MATYKPIPAPSGSPMQVDGLPFGTFTDSQINGEQRVLLMQAIGAGLYEVVPDPDSEVVAVAAPVETPETGPLAPPTVYYSFIGGAQFWPGLPARGLSDTELTGDQRIEMWKAIAAGLYAPNEARLLTEEEGREARTEFEAGIRNQAALVKAEAEAQAKAEAEAAEAERKAQAEREAEELAARLQAETARLAAIEKAKAEAAAIVKEDDGGSPPGPTVPTDETAGTGQTPAPTDENGGAAPAKTPRARRGN